MTPLALRSITRDALSFYQQLGLRKQALALHFLDRNWEFTLSAGAVPREGRLQVDIDWGGARCLLRLDEAWVWQMAEAVLGSDNLSGLPDAVRVLVLDAAFSDISALVEEATRKRVSVLSTQPVSSPQFMPEAWMSGFVFSLNDGSTTTSSELWVDGLGLGFLANAMQRLETAPLPLHHYDTLTIPLRFGVGRVDLPHSSLRSLDKGDVILFDECWVLEEDHIFLQIGKHAGVRAAIERSAIMIKDDLGGMMQNSDAYEYNEETPIDSIPVRLTFDLGEREVSIAELRAMTTGYVFEMGRDLRRAVTIRANGSAIGEGELVDIEGQTGVSVLRLFNQTLVDSLE